MNTQSFNTIIKEEINNMTLSDAEGVLKNQFDESSLSCVIGSIKSWLVLLQLGRLDLANIIEDDLKCIHPDLDIALAEARVIYDHASPRPAAIYYSSEKDQHQIDIAPSDNSNGTISVIAKTLTSGLSRTIEARHWQGQNNKNTVDFYTDLDSFLFIKMN